MPKTSKSFRSRSSTDPDGLPAEDELVRRLTRGLPQTARTVTGPGDDCAAVCIPEDSGLLLLKADAVVEHVHFTRDMPAAGVGWKALCRAISDMAAMGGTPCEALVTVVLPRTVPFSWLQEVYRGMRRAARKFGCGIAGGETSSAPDGAPVVLSIAMTGEADPLRFVRRSGGRPGDVLCVSGRLGNSFASGRHLTFTPRLAEAAWLVRYHAPAAMMDLSDGLAKDLPRLADASGCGWRIDPGLLPCHRDATLESALTEGEDYELLLALPPAAWPAVAAEWKAHFPRVPLTRIGELAPRTVREPELSGGWEHFS